MSIDADLKALILSRYKSIREFSITIDMPYTTLYTIFERGIENASIGNVIRICKALKISTDELAEGRIVSIIDRKPIPIDHTIEINDILGETKSRLRHGQTVTLNGKKIDIETIDTICQGIDISVEFAEKTKKKV